jgi:hypothetical protein
MFDVTFAHKNKRKVLKVKASVAVTKLLLPWVHKFPSIFLAYFTTKVPTLETFGTAGQGLPHPV